MQSEDAALEQQRAGLGSKIAELDKVITALAGIEDPEVRLTYTKKLDERAQTKERLNNLRPIRA